MGCKALPSLEWTEVIISVFQAYMFKYAEELFRGCI